MADFAYKAKDKAGKIRTGTVAAASKAAAKARLTQMRLMPISIEATKANAAPADPGSVTPILGQFLVKDANGNIAIQLFGPPKPTPKDVVVFTKQFSTMLNSGVPLIQALGILGMQQRLPAFGGVLMKIRRDVENGQTLSGAMQEHTRIFDNLYVAMVRAGEASGNLDTILLKLVTYIEKAAKIKSQVKSAMMYPMIVVVVAIAVISALLLFVVPAFAKQFSDSGKELPALTQIVIDMSNFLKHNFIYVGIAAGAAFFAFQAWRQTPRGMEIWDKIVLKLPGIGELIRKVAVGRFCSTMATMLTSGVNLLDALSICASSAGNRTIEEFVKNVRVQIEQGTKLSVPLAEGGLFPAMVVSMVSVGEATGALDEMLLKVSEFYEDEVDLAVKTVLSMIEPIMIVGIGSVVGFIVIAMYLPIFDMAGTVG